MSSTRRNAFYNIAYRVFSILLPLVTAPYLSRTVGQHGVGLYSYAWSISYIFCLIAMLGLSDYGVRAIAQAADDREALNRTYSEIRLMQLFTAGVMLIAWLVYVFAVAGEEKAIAFHLTMMSVSCLVNPDWCLMGLNEFRPIALRNTFVKLVAAACVFIFVRTSEDLWIYAFVWSLATLAGCLLCIPNVHKHVRLVRVSWRGALRHLKPCAVLSISVLAVSIYRTMDKVMVGAISGMAENGLYENAEKIVYCLSGFISAIGTVMMPKAVRMMKNSEEEALRAHMVKTMEVILCMTAAMAFGLAAVADRFAPLFYGESFAASGTLMIPLGFTLMMIGFANVVRTQWVIPGGHDFIFVRSVLCGAGVNLAANLICIPRLGAMGAVIGTLLAEFTVPLVQWIILRKQLPYRSFFRLCGEYTIIGLVMAIAVRLCARITPENWLGLVLQVVCGGVVYGGPCLLLWVKGKRQHMLRLLKRNV